MSCENHQEPEFVCYPATPHSPAYCVDMVATRKVMRKFTGIVAHCDKLCIDDPCHPTLCPLITERKEALIATPPKTTYKRPRMSTRGHGTPYRKMSRDEAVRLATERNCTEVKRLVDNYDSFWKPSSSKRNRK